MDKEDIEAVPVADTYGGASSHVPVCATDVLASAAPHSDFKDIICINDLPCGSDDALSSDHAVLGKTDDPTE